MYHWREKMSQIRNFCRYCTHFYYILLKKYQMRVLSWLISVKSRRAPAQSVAMRRSRCRSWKIGCRMSMPKRPILRS